jgi:ApaG protein
MKHGSEAVTRGVRVEVESFYVPERSSPEDQQWLFGYRIRISNEGERRVQLLSRHWIITETDGKIEEVRGPGVVGEHPDLAPGQSFEYTSACPLTTPFGTMHGTYQMVDEDGNEFDVEIAPFPLGEPNSIN